MAPGWLLVCSPGCSRSLTGSACPGLQLGHLSTEFWEAVLLLTWPECCAQTSAHVQPVPTGSKTRACYGGGGTFRQRCFPPRTLLGGSPPHEPVLTVWAVLSWPLISRHHRPSLPWQPPQAPSLSGLWAALSPRPSALRAAFQSHLSTAWVGARSRALYPPTCVCTCKNTAHTLTPHVRTCTRGRMRRSLQGARTAEGQNQHHPVLTFSWAQGSLSPS